MSLFSFSSLLSFLFTPLYLSLSTTSLFISVPLYSSLFSPLAFPHSPFFSLFLFNFLCLYYLLPSYFRFSLLILSPSLAFSHWPSFSFFSLFSHIFNLLFLLLFLFLFIYLYCFLLLSLTDLLFPFIFIFIPLPSSLPLLITIFLFLFLLFFYVRLYLLLFLLRFIPLSPFISFFHPLCSLPSYSSLSPTFPISFVPYSFPSSYIPLYHFLFLIFIPPFPFIPLPLSRSSLS